VVPFESLDAVFYSLSIVTMALSRIVFQRLIGRKSLNFYTQPVFCTPAGDTSSEFGEGVFV